MASAAPCRVPALERVTGTGGRGQSAVLVAVLHLPGRFGRLAAVAVERERVRVHRPMRVQGHVTRHGLVEVVPRASVPGRVPALERVAGARRIGWPGRLGSVLHRLRGHSGTTVRIEINRVGTNLPLCIQGYILSGKLNGSVRTIRSAGAVRRCVPAGECVSRTAKSHVGDSRALSDRTLDRFHETGGGSVSGEGNGRKRDCDLLGEAVALTVHSDGRCAWSFCM